MIVLAFDGPTPNIDQRDPLMPVADQMIGRHLRQVLRRGAGGPHIREVRVGRHHIPRLHEGPPAGSLFHLLPAPGDEAVHITLVVGKEHEPLEVLRRGRRVVLQPDEGIVDPRRGEQRQRVRDIRRRNISGVGDCIVNPRKFRHREDSAKIVNLVRRQVGRGLRDSKGQGDRLPARANKDRPVIVSDQEVKLFAIITAEDVRPGQRCAESAGRGQLAIGGVGRLAHFLGRDGIPT